MAGARTPGFLSTPVCQPLWSVTSQSLPSLLECLLYSANDITERDKHSSATGLTSLDLGTSPQSSPSQWQAYSHFSWWPSLIVGRLFPISPEKGVVEHKLTPFPPLHLENDLSVAVLGAGFRKSPLHLTPTMTHLLPALNPARPTSTIPSPSLPPHLDSQAAPP